MSRMAKIGGGISGGAQQQQAAANTTASRINPTWQHTPWSTPLWRLFGYHWRKWSLRDFEAPGVNIYGWKYQTNKQRAREALKERYGERIEGEAMLAKGFQTQAGQPHRNYRPGSNGGGRKPRV
jgi:hypothetical protein